MDVKAIKRVDSAAKSASISKYSPDRQGGESGRKQKFSDSYKPKPEKKEADDLDKFFAGVSQKPDGTLSEFEVMLKKMWEDNKRMKKSAKTLTQNPEATDTAFESTWIWGINGSFRNIIRK